MHPFTQNKDQNTDRSTRVLHSKYTVYHIYRTGCTISIVDTAEFYLGISTAVLFVRKLTLPVCSVISSLISGASFLTPAKSFEALEYRYGVDGGATKGILSWVGHSFDSVRTCVIAIAQMTVENE